MGLTLPTGIEKRVEDDFAYTFLRLCAEAELCFRPDEAQLGYWFAHKTNTYLRNGDEPHRRGKSVLAPLHIFDVLDIAYTHPVGGFLSQHIQESDICEPYRRCPAHFIIDFLCARAVYPRWRLLGASRSRLAPIVSIDNDRAQMSLLAASLLPLRRRSGRIPRTSTMNGLMSAKRRRTTTCARRTASRGMLGCQTAPGPQLWKSATTLPSSTTLTMTGTGRLRLSGTNTLRGASSGDSAAFYTLMPCASFCGTTLPSRACPSSAQAPPCA